MKYFTEDFNLFFIDLAGNNNKTWMDENRKRYEGTIREPFKKFIGDVISDIQDFGVDLPIEPKDCIFRINRDIRFSQDKTPYKMQTSAIISPKGKKAKDFPGLYLEFSPEHIRIYGGVYQLSTASLHRLRTFMSKNSKRFRQLISDEAFVNCYGEIRGGKNKRIPKEFMKNAEEQPLLYNKQFYYFTQISPDMSTSEDLKSKIMDAYKIGFPVLQFLEKGLG